MIPSDPYLLTALHLYLRDRLPLCPEGIDLARVRRVLDVGCGPNHWGRDFYRVLAERFGKEAAAIVAVDGVDRDEAMVRFACEYSRANRSKVTAYLGDMYHLPAHFHGYYDLVHARFLCCDVPAENWHRLLIKLAHLCIPGGWLVWSEPSMPARSPDVPAWNQLLSWIERALKRTGSPGVMEQMGAAFMQAGIWQEIVIQDSTLEFDLSLACSSQLPDGHIGMVQSLLTVLHGNLLASGVTSAPRLDATIRNLFEECANQRVTCQWAWRTISGKKC